MTSAPLLTPDQFAARAVGIPWARWRASWTATDCFGLLILWHRHVAGCEIDITPDAGAPDASTAAGWLQGGARAGWRPCEAGPGAAAFMDWRDGAPNHCGVVLAGDRLLHCEGSAERPGSVRVSRLRAMRAVFSDLCFYRFDPS